MPPRHAASVQDMSPCHLPLFAALIDHVHIGKTLRVVDPPSQLRSSVRLPSLPGENNLLELILVDDVHQIPHLDDPIPIAIVLVGPCAAQHLVERLELGRARAILARVQHPDARVVRCSEQVAERLAVGEEILDLLAQPLLWVGVARLLFFSCQPSSGRLELQREGILELAHLVVEGGARLLKPLGELLVAALKRRDGLGVALHLKPKLSGIV
mmetsp:Transcript_5665/g.17951  ORF Transcript_5665/g.17951 Transcript_5665/m.17951 type:complete len:213 (-) Transcript_5665:437-1075(-)